MNDLVVLIEGDRAMLLTAVGGGISQVDELTGGAQHHFPTGGD
ncbi:hypothetical protein [Corynebacterium glucuronolyticum]|nr:hypothetical protein [Corynebacterium glucuronolyticum]